LTENAREGRLLESTHLLTLTGAGGVCKNRLGLALRGVRTTPKIG